MDSIGDYFIRAFREKLAILPAIRRRVGAELKFPLVREDGEAASYETVCMLWLHLSERGWEPWNDPVTGEVVGARKPGEMNFTVASCETGYCKTEFSLAHVADLFEMERQVRKLREELAPFAEKHRVHFLGYGIQPVTPPGKDLLMTKSRAGVFDRVLRSNRHIPEERGHDVHLFTINAASHVHVSVAPEEAVPLVNVLNGFAGAQIALTADSNIWQGRIDPEYKCVAEQFWDWWMPESNRVGVPQRPFQDLEDYVRAIGGFRPIYVKRDGQPIILRAYASFEEYYSRGRAKGIDLEGREVSFEPEEADIDLHGSCYWYDARVSRYYTVENRVNDQQPPGELLCVPALTLGLASALDEADEEISSHDWDNLRSARQEACRIALAGKAGALKISDLARAMLGISRRGLQKRGRGEEVFLSPLEDRLKDNRCPADQAARLFNEGGIAALLSERAL